MPTTADIFNKYLDDPTGAHLTQAKGRYQGNDFQVAEDASAALLEQLSEMRLVVASMLKMLVDSGTLTREQLAKMADELDALDGSADGKLTGRLGPDGTIAIERPAPPDALDQLAKATRGRDR